MGVILDTSVIVDPPDSLPAESAISVATLTELHFGVQATDDTELRGRRLVRLGEVESRFEAIPIDAVVAREYGRLAAALLRRGCRPRSRVMDLLIAATAAALQLPVLTRDADLLALSDLLDVRRPS